MHHFCFVYRFGNAGGGPAGGLDGRLGGGPPGGPRPPGKGGGALLVGGAGISLIGVEGAELAVLAEPLAELETLSLKTQYIYLGQYSRVRTTEASFAECICFFFSVMFYLLSLY